MQNYHFLKSGVKIQKELGKENNGLKWLLYYVERSRNALGEKKNSFQRVKK